jgi:hypothetical protein
MATLIEGSSGPEVKELQAKLKEHGFDPNGVVGDFWSRHDYRKKRKKKNKKKEKKKRL